MSSPGVLFRPGGALKTRKTEQRIAAVVEDRDRHVIASDDGLKLFNQIGTNFVERCQGVDFL